MAKELNLNEIKKQDKKLDNKKKINLTLHNGDVYSLNVDQEFRPSKISKFTLEYGIVMEEIKEKGIDQDTLANTLLVENMLLIRNFTSLEIPLSIAEFTAYATRLIDLEIFEQILKAFDQTQIDKLNRITKKTLENIPLLNNKINAVFEEITLQTMSGDQEEAEIDGTTHIQ